MSDHSAPPPAAPSGLALTGERTLPGIPAETYWFERHVVAYELARDHVRGRVVLDAGCGEGYGLAMLADAGAARVVGIDLDPAVVAHVDDTYAARHPAIEVHAAELMALPLADGEIDVTVSFQVIEHLHDIPGYLASLRRATRAGGRILIATPNRLTFTPGSDVPVNPFHTREFTARELTDELQRAGLEVADVLGVHHGRRLRAIERLVRRPFGTLLAERPPAAWPAWLRTLVPRIRASWFDVRSDDLDASLDLIAVCDVHDGPIGGAPGGLRGPERTASSDRP